jgi:transposase
MQSAAEHTDYKALYERLKEETDYAIASLKLQIEQLKKMIFGSKSERFVAVDDKAANPQLTLDLDAETIAQFRITDAKKVTFILTKTEVTENKPKVHPGRMKLPLHLRRETTILQPETDVTGLRSCLS